MAKTTGTTAFNLDMNDLIEEAFAVKNFVLVITFVQPAVL